MPRASFFEEMQHLTPANAMLHGAKPYVDVVPPHGLIQDALLDYVILRTGPKTLGHVLRVRLTLNGMTSVLFYAVGAEATGSADLGFLAFSVSAIMGQGGGFFRFAPGVFCLLVCTAPRPSPTSSVPPASTPAMLPSLPSTSCPRTTSGTPVTAN